MIYARLYFGIYNEVFGLRIKYNKNCFLGT